MIMDNKIVYYLFAPFGFGLYDSERCAKAHFDKLFDDPSCKFALLVKVDDAEWDLLNAFVDGPDF